jgi:hypothetical protein
MFYYANVYYCPEYIMYILLVEWSSSPLLGPSFCVHKTPLMYRHVLVNANSSIALLAQHNFCAFSQFERAVITGAYIQQSLESSPKLLNLACTVYT